MFLHRESIKKDILERFLKLPPTYMRKVNHFKKFFKKYGHGFVKVGCLGGEAVFKTTVEDEEEGAGARVNFRFESHACALMCAHTQALTESFFNKVIIHQLSTLESPCRCTPLTRWARGRAAPTPPPGARPLSARV